MSISFSDSIAEWDRALNTVVAVGRIEEANRPANKRLLTGLTDMDGIIYENGRYGIIHKCRKGL